MMPCSSARIMSEENPARRRCAVQRGDFVLVDGAAKVGEAAFEARADERGFVGFGEDGIERGIRCERSGTPRARSSRAMRKRPWRRSLGVLRGVVERVAWRRRDS